MPVTAPSKPKQNWKVRRQKAAKRASKRSTVTARIQLTTEFELMKACGWDVVKDRDMRHPEPPTRSTNGNGPRLNKRNGWAQDGQAASCVDPVDSATWLWFSTLEDGQQDELCDLSAKCSDKARVSSTVEVPETKELLSKSLQLAAAEKDDPKEWGRK